MKMLKILVQYGPLLLLATQSPAELMYHEKMTINSWHKFHALMGCSHPSHIQQKLQTRIDITGDMPLMGSNRQKTTLTQNIHGIKWLPESLARPKKVVREKGKPRKPFTF